ncbi:class I SAM-dependent methyltransferase, partial [Arcobacter sp.]
MVCNICQSSNSISIYKSLNGSLSSLCDLNKNNINVFLCTNCLHIYTDFNIEESTYYDLNYNILIDTEDEDQLYKTLDNGEKLYRTEHQLNLLLSKLNINNTTKILDFGCAKSSTMKALSERTGIKPYLFDISKNYEQYWNFTSKENYATYEIPKDWFNKFSVVTSFFSLEHIKNPIETIKMIENLLISEGKLFLILPNPLINIADILVNEHFNHFTPNSIIYMLQNHGFCIEEIDTESYFGAFVIIAKKSNINSLELNNNAQIIEEVKNLGKYWQNITNKVSYIESKINKREFAIYGSGFYGSFIYSQMTNTENLKYFIDMNPYRYKYMLFEKNIIAPQN